MASPDGRNLRLATLRTRSRSSRKLGRPTDPCENERVDEEAEEILRLRLSAPPDRGAHEDVFLTGVPVEKHLEGSQEHHVERRARTTTERRERVHLCLRQHERLGRAAVAKLGGRGLSVGSSRFGSSPPSCACQYRA